MKKALAFLWLTFLCVAGPALAVNKSAGAPESLEAFRDWVLYGYEEQYYCPALDDGARACAWPVALSLELGQEGGRFAAAFDLLTEGVFTLPGGPNAWPRDLTDAKGLSVPVLGEAAPQVWLPAGHHVLTGRFEWPRLPETIAVPLSFVLDLTVGGKNEKFPVMEVDYEAKNARLWLSREADETPPETAAKADSLSVAANRLLLDSQPMIIVNRFRLTVTGESREILLENALLPETRATLLRSPLPAQLAGDALRVKVKPGVYEIVLESRALGRSESVGPAPEKAGWEREFWAFQAQPQLRLAEISGAEQIDPSQADIFEDWKQYPIYAPEPGQKLLFTDLRRGDPEARPDQLTLARECWLDYDGLGLSCRDRLSGTLSRQWHLNASPPFTLAQASLDGQAQVITEQVDSKGQKAPGLQLRKGALNLSADLRIDGFKGELPASGWDHALETEPQLLNLPPGYHVFHAAGADVLRGSGGYGAGSWTGAWTTLDFFIVLIIAIAVWKLHGLKWGLLALLAMIFCYQEQLAPRMVFLHLLAAAALLRLLPPAGRLRLAVRVWRFAAVLVLLVLSSLFIISQARVVIYPQLENPRTWFNDLSFGLFDSAGGYDYAPSAALTRSQDKAWEAEAEIEDMAMIAQEPSAAMPSNMETAKSLRMRAAPAPKALPSQSSLNLMSPDAKVQNSLARPNWNWRSVRLQYNGSVSADQSVKLYFISPALGRLLGLIRIALMSLFTLMMLAEGRALVKSRREDAAEGGPKPGFPAGPQSAAALFALAFFLLPAAPAPAQTAFPDQEMLDEFRKRLIFEAQNAPAAFPRAAFPQARLTLEADRLLLEMDIEAGRPTVWPLPSLDQEFFRYSRVTLNGERDLPLAANGAGRLFTHVPEGRHRVVLEGALRLPAGRDSFQINFAKPALPLKVSASGDGWQLLGLSPDGSLRGEALTLMAAAGAAAADDGAQSVSQILEPFFIVNRTLSLGLEWRVFTTVSRLSPAEAPVSLSLPLIPGEEPMGEEFQREGGRMLIHFAPGADSVAWTSRLESVPELALKAEDGPFTESWALDASSLWRVKYEGLTPIHTAREGFWQPAWRPWPGEELRLSIDRPQPVPGKYRVIDSARLNLKAAENMRDYALEFTVRGSQAGPYGFTLPPGAAVKSFMVDGQAMPLTPAAQNAESEVAGGPSLSAPLSAGAHEVAVNWTEEKTLGAVVETPALDLGEDTANISLALTLPETRWVLWTSGPMNGPAVQFWPLLAVLLLVSFILSRYAQTPLSLLSWFLLGLGLIQLNIFGAMLVAGWILAIAWREKLGEGLSRRKMNVIQIILALWTLAALVLIYKGVEYGLLANPDMLIEGGGSYGQRMIWFVDRASAPWETGRVYSVSLWYYKALMLAWSLWLAVNLIRWLKWAWKAGRA